MRVNYVYMHSNLVTGFSADNYIFMFLVGAQAD